MLLDYDGTLAPVAARDKLNRLRTLLKRIMLHTAAYSSCTVSGLSKRVYLEMKFK